MATDQHPNQGRRPQFHRGRRGHDRRGDRRPAPPPQGGAESQPDQPDVDQIVRDIKARIAQRHGIELSAQQIQELAARRLEAILDPRTVKPGLLDQLRKAAGAPAEIAPAQPADPYTFEDHTIYDTHNGFVRFLRRLLNPLLKLFFNPNPIAAALNAQVTVNRETARREAERERTQAEWNALHYTLLQRLVTEVSRVSLEMQSLVLRVESLATRADFTERRIRGLEAVPAPPPAVPSRTFDVPAPAAAAQPSSSSPSQPRQSGGEAGSGDSASDGSRRRRRRRRGRRGPGQGGEPLAAGTAVMATQTDAPEGDDDGFDDGPEGEQGEAFEAADVASPPEVAASAPQETSWASEPAPPAPEPAPFAAAPLPADAAPAESPADAPNTSDVTPPADSSGS